VRVGFQAATLSVFQHLSIPAFPLSASPYLVPERKPGKFFLVPLWVKGGFRGIVYGLGMISTFGCILIPPPVTLGAYMLVVPSFAMKSAFHPPLMVTVPVLPHTGSAGVKVLAA
jgi:hypothetical protein